MGRRPAQPERRRPMPPASVGDTTYFQPAPEVHAWVRETVLAEAGLLHNPEHQHLIDADLEFLWAAEGFAKQGRSVIGTAEQVTFRAGGWQKIRQEVQMHQWFGRAPTYLITLDAAYCRSCSDTDFCALVEHELYHVGHARDEFGAPAFKKDGTPKLFLRGHDVQEFVSVVARYGTGGPDSYVAKMVRAANKGPTVAHSHIAGACGTCLLKAA